MKYISLLAEYRLNTDSLPKPTADMGRLDMVLNIAFGILGAIAVLVIVIAGFKYILSRGEPRDMAQARMMIIYALVGLGISIAAYSIVTFVIRVL